MAWAFVQKANSANAQWGPTNHTTVAATFSGAVGSGNFVVGHVTSDTSSGQALTGVSDDKGNIYTIGLVNSITADTQYHATFYLWNITNAPTIITATFSPGAQFQDIEIAEYSGVQATGDPKDIQEGRT